MRLAFGAWFMRLRDFGAVWLRLLAVNGVISDELQLDP